MAVRWILGHAFDVGVEELSVGYVVVVADNGGILKS